MMERLLRGKAWVVFNFKDGTKVTVYTTISREILRSEGVEPRKDCLWDFHRGMYIPFRQDAESVDIFEDMPVYDEEVLNFASRFI